jgi:hypothetical protein
LSTEPRIALILAVLLAAAACQRPETTPALGALCRGADVEAPLRLVVDSIRPTAGAAAADLAGKAYDVTLAFRAGEPREECAQRTGRVAFEGPLPDALASAMAADRVGLWRIAGDSVAVDLNPSARDNNLTLVLPMSGGPGHWGWSTFAGEVLRGRAEERR